MLDTPGVKPAAGLPTVEVGAGIDGGISGAGRDGGLGKLGGGVGAGPSFTQQLNRVKVPPAAKQFKPFLLSPPGEQQLLHV